MTVTGYIACPHCGNDDPSMLELVPAQAPTYRCEVCSKEFVVRHKGTHK